MSADVVGRARTGCGKTYAFTLPIIERMVREQQTQGSPSRAAGRQPSVIIMTPTRELAKQVRTEHTLPQTNRTAPTLLLFAATHWSNHSIRQLTARLTSSINLILAVYWFMMCVCVCLTYGAGQRGVRQHRQGRQPGVSVCVRWHIVRHTRVHPTQGCGRCHWHTRTHQGSHAEGLTEAHSH